LREVLLAGAGLALLAAAALPSLRTDSEAVALERLSASLGELRAAIDNYWLDHDGFPGPQAEHVLAQLTGRSDASGRPAPDGADSFGPYLPTAELPVNPLNGRRDLKVLDRLPREPDGSSGWLYSPLTGEVRANVGDTRRGVLTIPATRGPAGDLLHGTVPAGVRPYDL